MLSIVIQILSFLPSMFLGIYYFERYAQVRHKYLFGILMMAETMVGAWLACGMTDLYLENRLLIIVVHFFVEICLLLYFGTITVPLRVVTFLIGFGTSTISELVVQCIMPEEMMDINAIPLERMLVYRLIAFVVYAIVLEVIYSTVWEKLIHHSDAKSINPFLLFILSQWMCVFVAAYDLFFWVGKRSLPICAVLITVSVCGDLGLYYAVRKLNQANLLEQEVGRMEQQMDMQAVQYRQLREQMRQSDQLRHDFKNQMQTVQYLIDSGETKQASTMLDELLKQKIAGFHFCRNGIVNAVLSGAAARCEEQHIKLESDLNLPEDLPMSSLDLCSLFCNLMDNAVEACMRSGVERPEIQLTGGIRNGDAIIRLTNTKNTAEKPQISGWKTTKANADQHGFGTKIIENILTRNDGYMTSKDLGGQLEIVVSLGKCEAISWKDLKFN